MQLVQSSFSWLNLMGTVRIRSRGEWGSRYSHPSYGTSMDVFGWILSHTHLQSYWRFYGASFSYLLTWRKTIGGWRFLGLTGVWVYGLEDIHVYQEVRWGVLDLSISLSLVERCGGAMI
ncbi:hypothetical protein M0R45_018710 [Rubus argutus]|uniref:Uncharacterized protein n=1 Tax=Rubus argutus TaxID=59490 RepID=A0AAW1X4W1_RUBAR